MAKSGTEIAQLLQASPNKAAIEEAQDHEARIRFHAEAVDQESRASSYKNRFFSWVQDGIKLPADKFAAFKAQCRFPVLTNGLVNSIFDEYKKVFSGTNPIRTFSFTEGSLEPDFIEYLGQKKVQEWFADKGFEALKTHFNSILFVDLPAVQATARPEPYFYLVPIDKVKHLKLVPDGLGGERIEEILFESRKDFFVFADSTAYQTFEKTEKGDYVEQGNAPIPPAVGRCPAEFLNPYNLYKDNGIIKRSPLSSQATDFDWLLFFKAAKRTFETYGPFPIMTAFVSRCTYADPSGNTCSEGLINYTTEEGKAAIKKCPACSAKSNLIGPGTVIDKPTPRGKEDAYIEEAVTITSPEVDSLDYLAKEVDSLEWDIYETAVGSTDQALQKQAINKDQVSGTREGKVNVLRRIKKIFDHGEGFVCDIFGRLRYANLFEGCFIDNGSEFDFLTAEDYAKQFAEAKKENYPEFVLYQKLQRFIDAEARTNSEEKQRLETLMYLEPWPNLSVQDCVSLTYHTLFPLKFAVKSEFSKYISTFELQNGSLVQFGSLLNQATRLQQI